MRLVDSKMKKPLKIGQKVTTFRGETGKLTGIFTPNHPGSTGRVEVKIKGGTNLIFPSVINAEWEGVSAE